mmetsp:Transcript_21010/g.42045  ORF Transcript_21010/g.42045 Transcript_21010/m.42045 type:complete len:94 (-) Transcript_21010:795-1076(-)
MTSSSLACVALTITLRIRTGNLCVIPSPTVQLRRLVGRHRTMGGPLDDTEVRQIAASVEIPGTVPVAPPHRRRCRPRAGRASRNAPAAAPADP